MREAIVVYADILGFADLVMSMGSDIDHLDGFSHSTMTREELRERFEEGRTDPLERTFAAFHRILDLRVSNLVNVDPLQSIVFSDSAFVVFRDLNTATYFAQAFMRDLISFRVPTRMGIGRGTFRGLRLTTDISDEVRRHSSQFLGTGVIRAHQAESCGLKGLRILIHPDTKLKEDWPGDLCEVPEGTVSSAMTCPVTHELNYLDHYPDFAAKVGGPQTPLEAYDEIVAAVTEMMDKSPESVKIQYQATLYAVARMCDAYNIRVPTPTLQPIDEGEGSK